MRDRKLVVAALCRDEEGRILLAQRRPDQAMPLGWELPGGKIESGEAPVGALERELREELGVGATIGAIFEVVFHAYPEFDLVMLVYAVTLAETPRPVDVADLAWVTPDRFGEFAILPADRPLMERLRREFKR